MEDFSDFVLSWDLQRDSFSAAGGRLANSKLPFSYKPGPAVIKVVVTEGSDVILPCSLSTNIESERFNWKKDGQKEVFLYDAVIQYNNGRTRQDEQFKGRVSHFEDELKFGNASIIIRNTKAADSGDYTCDFPDLQPERRIFHIQLVVGYLWPLLHIVYHVNTDDGWDNMRPSDLLMLFL